MRFHIVTIFPELFDSFLRASLLGKAVQAGLLQVEFVDPRSFTEDRHHSTDDAPFGGGDGMVMRPEPVVLALESIQSRIREAPGPSPRRGWRFLRRASQAARPVQSGHTLVFPAFNY